jgi:hypothetical protein
VDANLQLGDKPVEPSVGNRGRDGFNTPDRTFSFFPEFDGGERRGKCVIARREIPRLAGVRTAKDGVAVHSVGRNMDGRADAIRWNGIVAFEPRYSQRNGMTVFGARLRFHPHDTITGFCGYPKADRTCALLVAKQHGLLALRQFCPNRPGP